MLLCNISMFYRQYIYIDIHCQSKEYDVWRPISMALIWHDYGNDVTHLMWDPNIPGKLDQCTCTCRMVVDTRDSMHCNIITVLNLGLRQTNERPRYKVTMPLIGWAAQTYNQPCNKKPCYCVSRRTGLCLPQGNMSSTFVILTTIDCRKCKYISMYKTINQLIKI